MSKNVTRRGRPSKMTSRFVAEVLQMVSEGNGAPVSKYLMSQIEGRGYLEYVKVPRSEHMMGRTRMEWSLTSKGRNYLRLSKNWFKPLEVPVVETEEVAA